jgi:CubicO group peptidase (beta-lactamase class C family)
MEIEGYCDPAFERVAETFSSNFERGLEVGASVAASVDGELVFDLWGGHANASASTPWTEHTLANLYSTTKPMAALCVHLLADRGQLDLDTPVAAYWPEFASAGKRDVLVRHLLCHAAGLSGLDVAITVEEMYDHDRIAGLLAVQAPWWEPGTQSGYHVVTYGYLLGELVRRVSGVSLGAFFRAEIAEPLGADLLNGVTADDIARLAEVVPLPGGEVLNLAPGQDSIPGRSFAHPPLIAAEANTRAWQQAELPAVNGYGNARSVVRAQTPMACGGTAFGVTLLSTDSVDRAFTEQTFGVDVVLGGPMRYALGYGLAQPEMPMGANPDAAFWGGWGGSMVVIDPAARTCFGYVPNRMWGALLGDERLAGLFGAFLEARESST